MSLEIFSKLYNFFIISKEFFKTINNQNLKNSKYLNDYTVGCKKNFNNIFCIFKRIKVHLKILKNITKHILILSVLKYNNEIYKVFKKKIEFN